MRVTDRGSVTESRVRYALPNLCEPTDKLAFHANTSRDYGMTATGKARGYRPKRVCESPSMSEASRSFGGVGRGNRNC